MRAAAALVVLLAAAAPALAHDGTPRTTAVYFQPGAPRSLYVVSSLGLLVSHDDGCTFHWVCETAIGYAAPVVPKLAIARDGAIFATTFTGVRVSRDGGCSFANLTDPQLSAIYTDALDLGSTGELWLGTSESGRTNDLYVSTDNGATFTARGLATTTFLWNSLRVAPSDPAQVYATAARVGMPYEVRAVRSNGDAWIELPLTGVALGAVPGVRIAAIDPADARVVYLISRDVGGQGDDRLYRSADGGDTFVQVLATTAATIEDVAVRGGAVYATTQVQQGPTVIGGPVFESLDGGTTFAPLAGAPELRCLGVSPDGALVGCGPNWQPDYMAITRSADARSWDKVWRFVELAGPLACTAPSFQVCTGEWDLLDDNLKTTGPACGALARDLGIPIEAPPPGGGCCSTAGRPTDALWAIAVALVGLRRRRARR